MRPRIGVAGAGLIGGSIVLRATELGWTAGVFDVDPAHARAALERLGASFVAGSLADLAARSDVLVLAAPLDPTLGHLAELEAVARTGRELPALIVDVASVKGPVARAGATLAAFVPTHPIAGSERSGPDAARCDLFLGRTWTYDPAAGPVACARAVRFIEAMGAVATPLASAEHDRIVALTSHLPQLLATALGSRLEPELRNDRVLALCGTGIRSMLRLAGSSWSVWNAVVRENAVPVAQEVRRLADILSGVAEALERDASDALAPDFARAAAALHRLDGNAPPSGAVASSNHPDER